MGISSGLRSSSFSSFSLPPELLELCQILFAFNAILSELICKCYSFALAVSKITVIFRIIRFLMGCFCYSYNV